MTTERRTRAITVIWQCAALLFVLMAFMVSGPYGFSARVTPGGSLTVSTTPERAVLYWLSWLAAAPVLLVANRVALTRRTGPRELGLHGLCALAGSALHALAFWVALRVAPGVAPRDVALLGARVVGLEAVRGLWDYVLLLAFVHVLSYARIIRGQARAAAAQEVLRARLEAELVGAKVGALQAQLHPHFLFNTLNAIAVLTTKDPALARSMVVQLGALLRAVTRSAGEQVMPLRRELDFVDRYLAIQRIRFGESLRVDLRIEEEALDACVPTFLLQPLVENAVRHAVEAAGQGTIVLEARRVADQLVLSVADDGAPGAAPSPGTGLGLENLRRRLALLFGDGQRVELRSRHGGGCIVEVAFPFGTSADALIGASA